MIVSKLNRRMFLQGLGGALLPIPFLESLLPREAWARRSQNAEVVKRYIAVISNYDYGHHLNWFPDLTRPSGILNPPDHHSVHYQPLRDYLKNRNQLSRILGPALSPYVDQMNLFRGLDIVTKFGHGSGHLLGNLQGVINNENLRALDPLLTIDQVLLRNKKFNPNGKELIYLSTNDDSYSWGYNSAGQIVPKSRVPKNVAQAFNMLFNNGQVPESGGDSGRTPHARADVLNRVLFDYNRVRKGRQISSIDKLVLDNATDKISDLQRGLQEEGRTTPAASCKYKSLDTSENGQHYADSLTFKNYANLMIAAMLCDISRVGLFSSEIWGYGRQTDPNSSFHQGHSHTIFDVYSGQVNWQYMGDIQRDFVNAFIVPLVQGLSAAVDPTNGQSFLHNSIVHVGFEHSLLHGIGSVPALLFGNAGGAITSGNLVDYTNWSLPPEPGIEGGWSMDPASPTFTHQWHGTTYNRLLVTVLQAMGLEPSDYENPKINRHLVGRTDSLYGPHNNNISHIGGYGYAAWKYIEATDPARNKMFDFNHFKLPLALPPQA